MTATKREAQVPLELDPALDALISHGAQFLGVTRPDLVAEAVRAYLESRPEALAAGMREAIPVLDGTTRSRLALLTATSPERIDELGGVRE